MTKFLEERKKAGFSIEDTCRILQVNSRRLRRWKELEVERGSMEDMRQGPKNPLNRLTLREITWITSMGVDAKYSHLSYREACIKARELDIVHASFSSFYRVWKSLGLINGCFRKSGHVSNRKVPAPKIKEIANCPNRVWSWDFTYVWTGSSWLYLLCILDVYSRRLMSWKVCERMTDDVAIELWDETLLRYNLFLESFRPCQLISFSDHGSQMTSNDTKDFFEKMKIPMEYARYKVPEDNSIHESFHKTLKHDKNFEYYFWKVSSKVELEVYMENMEKIYNYERYHSSLGYTTPNQMYMGESQKIIAKREAKNREARLNRIKFNKLLL